MCSSRSRVPGERSERRGGRRPASSREGIGVAARGPIEGRTEHEFPHKRFSDYDHVGPFKISYKGRLVLLALGSERFETLSEANGAALFELIREQANGLECDVMPREVFFQTLKDALRLAKTMGHAEDGRVAVRASILSLFSPDRLAPKPS